MSQLRGAHLVGSAPVTEPDEIFELAGTHLAGHLRRIGDGEVGERDTWIRWQFPKLGRCPQLRAEMVDTGYLGRRLEQYGVVDGAGPLELVDLGYADAVLDSYPRFAAAKETGTLPDHLRFMVGLPTPLSVITMYVAPTHRPTVLAFYLTAMETQLHRILDGIPHDQLAIQWEMCIEFGTLEGLWTQLDTGLSGEAAQPTIVEHVIHLGNLVPESVELGYHLCYGDSGHEHFTQPSDAGFLAWAMGTLLDGVDRPIQWIHLPVPRERHDVAYFAPLGAVDLPAATELYLGLVHQTDGEAGTRRRITAASQVLPRFGVATECGLGRRPPETIPALLDLHASVAEPR